MVNKEIFDLLKIGLTEGESKVYLALTELGSSTVGPIVKKSGVAYLRIRPNIFRLLLLLILFNTLIKNKSKYPRKEKL